MVEEPKLGKTSPEIKKAETQSLDGIPAIDLTDGVYGSKDVRKDDDAHSISHSSAGSIDPDPVSPEHAPSKSVPSSVRSRATTIIPRSKMRGLLARFAIIPEVARPQEYNKNTKWLITLLVALAGAAAPMGSAIFFRKS